MHINFVLGNLSLDAMGRVAISDELLEQIDSLELVISSGGSDEGCPQMNSGSCFNTTECSGMINSDYCSNYYSCWDATNRHYCNDGPG